MTSTIWAPPHITGDIALPASKSISNRALILNALATLLESNQAGVPLTEGGHHNLSNLAECDDTDVLIQALNNLNKTIDIGAAGTSMRFLTAFLCELEGNHLITGSERMKNRPIKLLVEALRTVGAEIEYVEKEGYPPLKITGKKLEGGSIQIHGGISSQYLSALMMAGPLMRNGLNIQIEGELISRPYFEMTISMMQLWGATIEYKNAVVEIQPGGYTPQHFTVESDWSAASYWYEMLSLAESGSLFLKGLNQKSLQGDKRISEWFELLGVHTEFKNGGAQLSKIETKQSHFEADLIDQPDLAQTLVVTCLIKGITFHISGLQSLKIKETDRLTALVNECAKLGFVLHQKEDRILEWTGDTKSMLASPIETYDDHRMAMAFAPVSVAYGTIKIDHPEVVTKSYPKYWDHLTACNFLIE
jgi:3-phosphoshikimate 1-carboxyvinyltransferase